MRSAVALLALLAGASSLAAQPAVLPAVPSAVPPGPVVSAAPALVRSAGASERRGEAEPAYRWPTGGPADLVRPFDPPDQPWGRGHRGVDLAHPEGAEVLAAREGVVVFAGRVVDRPVVSVQHADGIRTTYEPVSAAVRPGQRVATGELLGTLTAGHCPPWELTTCLHLGARRGPDSYVDPMALLGAEVVVRLLPPDMSMAR